MRVGHGLPPQRLTLTSVPVQRNVADRHVSGCTNRISPRLSPRILYISCRSLTLKQLEHSLTQRVNTTAANDNTHQPLIVQTLLVAPLDEGNSSCSTMASKHVGIGLAMLLILKRYDTALRYRANTQ